MRMISSRMMMKVLARRISMGRTREETLSTGDQEKDMENVNHKQ